MAGLKLRKKVENRTFPVNSVRGTAEAHGINLWVINMLMEGRIKKRAGCGRQMAQKPEANNLLLTAVPENRFKAEIRTFPKVVVWSNEVTSQLRFFFLSGIREAGI